MKSLKDIFLLNDEEHEQIKSLYNQKIVNRGFSKISYYLTKKFGSLLAIFGLNYISKYSNEVLLERSKDSYTNFSPADKKKGLKFKVGRIIGNTFHFKTIFQNFIDKILPYEKFMLNFKDINNFNVTDLEDEYSKLPDWETIRK